jgi:nucleoside 2-deoxyribosyltransferase
LLSYAFNGKENDYIQSLKDELESHGIQIYDTNYVGMEYDNRIALFDTIKICDILIAFMKENDDSVIYSIGYAMAKDKKVLVVRTDDSEAPSFLELVSTIPLRDYFDMSRDILNFVDNC